MDINIRLKRPFSVYFTPLRMASKRVHQSVLADLGGGAGPAPPLSHCPAQRRGPDDGGGHEVRLSDPPDGGLLDD